jgi:hypothetical protein
VFLHGYKYKEYPDMKKKLMAKRSLAKSGLVTRYILRRIMHTYEMTHSAARV